MSNADPYPSRVWEQPKTLPRQDPVVYGSAERGPLDAAVLARYEEQGFLHLEAFFSAGEVGVFQAELDRMAADADIRSSAQAIYEPGARHAVRSIFAVHTSSPIFRNLVADARLVDMVRQLLGGGVYVHQSRINYKPGFEGKPFHWHSDFETWHVEDGMPRMRALSCAISLSENNEFNGPLMVIPGSHRHFVSCVGETPPEHYKQSLRRQEYGVPDTRQLHELVERGGLISCKGPPGSLTIFDCNLMHGSTANLSPYPRNNVFIVYNSLENVLTEPYGGIPPRPEYIASRNPIEVKTS